MLKLAFALVLVAGGELPKVRCEYVAPPAPAAPAIPKERQAKLDELADLQLDIDLQIARADKDLIPNMEELIQSLHDASFKAAREHAKNANQMVKQYTDALDEVDKTIDRVARHRCGR